MIEVRKKEGESPISVIRRFAKRVQQSGNLGIVRGLRFRKRPESVLVKKRKALKKIESRERYNKLKKSGKIQ